MRFTRILRLELSDQRQLTGSDCVRMEIIVVLEPLMRLAPQPTARFGPAGRARRGGASGTSSVRDGRRAMMSPFDRLVAALASVL
jgi:hypothetical protein